MDAVLDAVSLRKEDRLGFGFADVEPLEHVPPLEVVLVGLEKGDLRNDFHLRLVTDVH